ncbi:MAG: glycosyl hydrolase [Acidobacteria bacterium]|nr:glycosyl hydrolase [Acidobacteriota bacterium]
MRASLRLLLAGITTVLFIAFIVLAPSITQSKSRGETSDKKDKSSRTETARDGKNAKRLPDLGGDGRPATVKITRQEEDEDSAYDPDLPTKVKARHRINKEEYLQLRSEYISSLRGLDPAHTINPLLRGKAIERMEVQQAEQLRAARIKASNQPELFTTWTEIGPRPIPNGQTQQSPSTAATTGRATMLVVDPTNSNKVYMGTAQGGVWRSTDGGSTWQPIFDAAQSLSIGAIALAPSDPTILYVGTGEPNNSADSFFGVGVYRIDNVDTTATLVGPINPSITTGSTTALTYNCFNGRAISKILVHPTDPATIFVSTAAGVSGASGNALSNTIPPLALRGVFRSTNATAAAGAVTFSKLIVNTDGSLDAPGTGNTSIFDMVLDPGFDGGANQVLLVTTSGTTTGGVVMRSTNALAATPTFTQVLFPGFNGLVMHLAINKVGAVVTAYCATNEPSGVAACSSISQAGRLRKSTDGGLTWSPPLTAAEGYCGGQCVYDAPVGVDPTDANVVYLGGNARGTCQDVLKKSTDGGTTFTRDDTGLHADSHYIFVDAVSSPHTVWFVNDGGVWKRQETAVAGGAPPGTAWLDQNNGPLGTVQFVSLAVHPTDQNFTIGGTQDNGTEAQTLSQGNWLSAEGGDGGFSLIDQSSTDTVNVTMYHTFFNQTNNLIGFDRTNLGACLAVKNSWEFRGFGGGTDPTPSCDGAAFAATNGLNGTDTVLFYAPMALGPGGAGNPNTLYFGTNKLYRSTDRGDTMTIVSQNPLIAGVAVSAIGIGPTDDNVRIVGMRNGNVFATTTGSTTLTNTAFPFPTNATASTTNRHIGRAVIDPLNSNTAYVTISYYTNPSTAGNIWRTTNLNSATPTWTSIGNSGNGLPNIPVNAFAVDGNDPSHPGVSVLYAGSDIGVYFSVDSGASWAPFGLGLPRVSVFDMAIQPTARLLRVATHGRGMWEKALPSPTAAAARISGSVTTADGSPSAGVTVRLSGQKTGTTITNDQGRYSFGNLDTGGFYTVTPDFANYHFSPANRSFSLVGDKTDATFTAAADAAIVANAIDTAEYFVRQQYLDFLGREPDAGGFNYWREQANSCNGDADCVRTKRIDVSAAFFLSQEFKDTGSFVYRLYKGALGRQLRYSEFSADRSQVVGGPNLESSKTTFAAAFVQRAEFTDKYQGKTTAEAFVDALLQTMNGSAGVNLSGERAALISRYNEGAGMNASRALVVRQLVDNDTFANAVYNQQFVAMQYFGYLRRSPDADGLNFWLNVLNNDSGNYRGMVCSFITSAEYQRRFGTLVSHSNSECPGTR